VTSTTGVTIRAMGEADLAAADHIYRLAFGTYFQLPQPMAFRGDEALVRPRWRTYGDGGLVAIDAGTIIGMSFASNWGSLGVLGPVAVHPDYWRHGVARLLLAATLAIFERWQSRLVGLFTFPQSAGHLRLYQEFGFWPRHFIPVMAKPIAASEPVPEAASLAGASDRAGIIAQCRGLTDAAFAGLDLSREIAGVVEDGLGDVILLRDGSDLAGFAICHSGAGSEGGSQSCYVKFALVRPGDAAPRHLARLIAACEDFARTRGAGRIVAGVATGRHGAYRVLIEHGFRMQLAGIAMHRPYAEGYDRAGVFALDDWR
jgi:GNAT superfamily N-acetyltransferase